jgi:hypothetical protein
MFGRPPRQSNHMGRWLASNKRPNRSSHSCAFKATVATGRIPRGRMARNELCPGRSQRTADGGVREHGRRMDIGPSEIVAMRAPFVLKTRYSQVTSKTAVKDREVLTFWVLRCTGSETGGDHNGTSHGRLARPGCIGLSIERKNGAEAIGTFPFHNSTKRLHGKYSDILTTSE